MSKAVIQWSVVLLKFCAVGGAGILGFVGLSEFVGGEKKRVNTIAIVIALVLLAAAACAAFVRLGKPASIMSVARNISSGTPVSLEFLAFVACVIVAVVYLFVTMRESSTKKALGIAAMIVAVAVGFTGGYSHQAMVGMTAWHSPAVSVSFLLSALVPGGFIYLALVALFGANNEGGSEEGDDSVDSSVAQTVDDSTRKMTLVLVGLSLLSTVALIANGLMVPLGSATVLYWILVSLVGGAVPLASAALLLARPLLAWIYLGAGGALVGAFALRATIWLALNAGLSKTLESAAIIIT
ncbi:MAG: polysulfide reductase NrfD [Coriobacteriales bacterium]|nr:polysulfide reductase NrfD [Coriobacteriales bacterium]